jgi:hypothetical protein
MSPWEFGWEALVAIGTLTLAFFTWRLARQTGDLARETANEVRSNARPVLIAAAGTGARLEVGGPPDKGYGTLVIPVHNAGRGPALNAFAYAITTTREGDARTNIVNVGNVPSDGDAAAHILGVKNVDATDSWERDGFLAIRAVVVYSDLAGAQFHTVVRLSDPGGGTRRDGATQWIDLAAEGTTVGQGSVPMQQWRVTFRGRHLDDEQVRHLRADAIQYFGGHSVGTSPSREATSEGVWSSTVFVFADRSHDAIERARAALGGDQAPFRSWAAEPWALEPILFRELTWRERVGEWMRRTWGRLRDLGRSGRGRDGI